MVPFLQLKSPPRKFKKKERDGTEPFYSPFCWISQTLIFARKVWKGCVDMFAFGWFAFASSRWKCRCCTQDEQRRLEKPEENHLLPARIWFCYICTYLPTTTLDMKSRQGLEIECFVRQTIPRSQYWKPKLLIVLHLFAIFLFVFLSRLFFSIFYRHKLAGW